MPTLATKPVPRCPRCLHPIVKNARIERFMDPDTHRQKWAHVGCKSPREIEDSQPVYVPDPSRNDGDADYDDVVNTMQAPVNPDQVQSGGVAGPGQSSIMTESPVVDQPTGESSFTQGEGLGGVMDLMDYSGNGNASLVVPNAQLDPAGASQVAEGPDGLEVEFEADPGFQGHQNASDASGASQGSQEALDTSGDHEASEGDSSEQEGPGDGAEQTTQGKGDLADLDGEDDATGDEYGDEGKGGEQTAAEEPGDEFEDEATSEPASQPPQSQAQQPKPQAQQPKPQQKPQSKPQEKPMAHPPTSLQKPKPQPQPAKPVTQQGGLEPMAQAQMEAIKQSLQAQMQQLLAQAARAAIPAMQAKISEQVKDAVGEQVGEMVDIAKETMMKSMGQFQDALNRKLNEASSQLQQVVHVIQTPDGLKEEMTGEVFHSAFDEIMELCANGFNVFLPGPTGCGKTHTARQVAKALKKQFYAISGTAGTTEAEVFGTSLPNLQTGENVYIETEFVRLYEHGGVVLLDEVDAMDPNMLLKLNSAIANDFCAIPKRTHLPEGVSMEQFHANPGMYPGYGPMAYRHPDFVCMAAANTWGTGASREYCGRNRLDEATIDRFRASSVPMDYDQTVEARFACPDVQLYAILRGWRHKMRQCKMRRILSTRFVRDAFKLKKMGKDMEYIAKKLAGGWSDKEQMDIFTKVVAPATGI